MLSLVRGQREKKEETRRRTRRRNKKKNKKKKSRAKMNQKNEGAERHRRGKHKRKIAPVARQTKRRSGGRETALRWEQKKHLHVHIQDSTVVLLLHGEVDNIVHAGVEHGGGPLLPAVADAHQRCALLGR